MVSPHTLIPLLPAKNVYEVESSFPREHMTSFSARLQRYLQILLRYLHSHRQFWVKRDTRAILDEPEVAGVRDFPYLGIHVRRGDKLIDEAEAQDVQVKLSACEQYTMNIPSISI